MIRARDNLGERFFFLEDQPGIEVGRLFAVGDLRSQPACAQFLAASPVNAEVFAQVRAELLSLPELPSLARPDAVLCTADGTPAAVFCHRLPRPLREALLGLAAEPMRNRVQRQVFEWFTRLAEDLAQAHAAGRIHGAIALDLLVVRGEERGESCVLTGFGIEACERLAEWSAGEPSARLDLRALALALHEAAKLARVDVPEAAQKRWSALVTSATYGDHPAFESARALAAFLETLLPQPLAGAPSLRPAARPALQAASSQRPSPQTSPMERASIRPAPTARTSSRPPPPRTSQRPALETPLELANLPPVPRMPSLPPASFQQPPSPASRPRSRRQYPLLVALAIVLAAGLFLLARRHSRHTPRMIIDTEPTPRPGTPRRYPPTHSRSLRPRTSSPPRARRTVSAWSCSRGAGGPWSQVRARAVAAVPSSGARRS